MAEFSPEDIQAFQTAFATLCDSFSLALSENVNQLVTFEPPIVTVEAVDKLIASAEPVLQTTFSFPDLVADEAVLAFPQSSAGVLADLIGGGDGSSASPATTLLDEQMNQVAEAMSGVVQGLSIAIGSALSRPLMVGACATALEALTLPPAFAVSGEAVQVSIDFNIEGVLRSYLRLFFTPNFARAILPAAASTENAAAMEPEGFERPSEDTAPSAGMASGSAKSTSSAFQPFDAFGGAPEALPQGMELIMDIPLDVSVELGRVKMLIKDVLELSTGSIVELERVAGEPVDMLVNGKLVAKGEVVVIDDNFGIRITEILSAADRLSNLGKRN
jgi:flagellar motor switch protein FliN/FliY